MVMAITMRMMARIFFRHREGHTRDIVKCPLHAHKTRIKVTLHVVQSAAVALKIQPKCPHVVEEPAWVISRVISVLAPATRCLIIGSAHSALAPATL